MVISAVPSSTFKPTPEIPAFQFVGSVDRDGSADKASLKVGDYLIEVCLVYNSLQLQNILLMQTIQYRSHASAKPCTHSSC